MLILSAPPDRHSLVEDAVAFVIAATLVALGIVFLQTAGLFTGQIAGAALIVSYLGGWPFGLAFFLLNLPFYIFAILRMGWTFTIKSFLAVAMMSSMTEYLGAALTIDLPHPALAALIGAVYTGKDKLAVPMVWATAALLALAGAWQFTPLKEACLSKCRQPMILQFVLSIGVVQRVMPARANSLSSFWPSSQIWPTCARLGSRMSFDRIQTLSFQRRVVT